MPTMAELAAAIVARQELPPEQGDMGPPGSNGKAGLDGMNGRNGDPGPKGDRGDRGQDGANGADGRVGADGKDGADGDPGLVWRGPWVRNLAYYPDDAVEQDGSSYVCTVATRSKPPSGAWDLLAKRGATGPPGMSRGGGGGSGGGSSSLTVKDEGTVLDTAAASIDFVGDGVTATAVGHSLTVTIPGGGGSQDLEAVLTEGNDGGALGIVNPGIIASLPNAGNFEARFRVLDATSDTGGQVTFEAGGSAGGNSGAVLQGYGGTDDGNHGGGVELAGGPGGLSSDGEGGYARLAGGGAIGNGDGGDVVIEGGAVLGSGDPGLVHITTGGSSGASGDVLTAQGDTTALWGTVIAALIAGGGQAAFVPDPATPEQIRDSLVAAGLMAAA